jgi:hypothetical protein
MQAAAAIRKPGVEIDQAAVRQRGAGVGGDRGTVL